MTENPDDEDVLVCDGCLKRIAEGEPHMSGGDATLCEACAPSYQDLIDDPSSFYDIEENPLTPEVAQKEFDDHIAAGGKPDDKLVMA